MINYSKIISDFKLFRCFFLLVFIAFCGSLYGQEKCNFEIIDTVYFRKSYFVTYEDTIFNNNTKYRYISFFSKNRRGVKKIKYFTKYDDFPIYLPLSSLITQLIVHQIELGRINTEINGLIIKEEKRKGEFTIYSIYSPNGFIHWKLSKEQYNNSRSIEGLKLLGTKDCVDVFSPSPIGRTAPKKK